jgi:organic hydroperoxide reductase OsmC/OhrA
VEVIQRRSSRPAFSTADQKGAVRLEVEAVYTFDDEQLKITIVDLALHVVVHDLNEEEFESAAREPNQICLVSNALRGNVEIQGTSAVKLASVSESRVERR